MKTKTMRKIGYGCGLVIITALLIGLEYMLSKLFGWTYQGVPYALYAIGWMSRHPIATCIEGIIIGIELVIGVDLLAKEE